MICYFSYLCYFICSLITLAVHLCCSSVDGIIYGIFFNLVLSIEFCVDDRICAQFKFRFLNVRQLLSDRLFYFALFSVK